MERVISILPILLLSCSTIPKNNMPEVLVGKYVVIEKRNNFYDELTLRFNQDSTFYFNQRLGPETFQVTGIISYIEKDVLELTVVDTTTILRKGPIYQFYNIKDTLVVLSANMIQLNGKRFKRVN